MQEIINQINLVSTNLNRIADSVSRISEKSFFDSQLFGAIIGAGSAIFIFLLSEILRYARVRREEVKDLHLKLAKNEHFFSPKSIWREAKHHMYGGTIRDAEGERTIPEKPLGEKMVIEFRTRLKYWHFKSLKLKRWFKKLEKAL